VEQNAKFCELCYCYVCDVPAAECKSWSNTDSPSKSNCHCLASDRGQDASVWTKLRQRPPSISRGRSTFSFYNSDFSSDNRLNGNGPYSPDEADAQQDYRLTKCRKCGWYSRREEEIVPACNFVIAADE